MITGRAEEQTQFSKILSSAEAEFVAVYGRRRVGKTYLIRKYFESTKGVFYFEVLGQKNATIKAQINNFYNQIEKYFSLDLKPLRANNWQNAFLDLTKQLQKVPKNKKIVIFIDELPWLSSKRSRVLSALDYAWNQEWSNWRNIKLFVCGSAASWMLDNLIHAKGGLYNRITHQIKLKPFSIFEVEQYLKSRSIKLKRFEILNIYMAIGGIPFYLRHIEKGLTSSQLIQKIFFDENGALFNEFDHLFESLFDHSDIHRKIVRYLAQSPNGLKRNELLEKLNMKSNGQFNKRLAELEASEFITRLVPFGRKRKNYTIKLIDEYSIFYLKWVDDIKKKSLRLKSVGKAMSNRPGFHLWKGIAFENFCFNHINQMIKALKIESEVLGVSSWRHQVSRKNLKDRGAQIDLVIERVDHAITLCEVKYADSAFVLGKTEAKNILHRIEKFSTVTGTNKQLFLVMITPFGVKKGLWNDEVFQTDLLLDDFFVN